MLRYSARLGGCLKDELHHCSYSLPDTQRPSQEVNASLLTKFALTEEETCPTPSTHIAPESWR